jgi:hypothetical protein
LINSYKNSSEEPFCYLCGQLNNILCGMVKNYKKKIISIVIQLTTKKGVKIIKYSLMMNIGKSFSRR